MKLKLRKNKNQGKEEGVKGKLLYARFEKSNIPPAIIVFLLDKRFVKDERVANLLILSLIFCFVIISLLIYINTSTYPVFIDRI